MGAGMGWAKCHLICSVLLGMAYSYQAEGRIKVMSSLDDETVYIVREKPIIMNIESPSMGMLIMSKPVNACGPIHPPPFPPVNSTYVTPSPQNLSASVPAENSSSVQSQSSQDFVWVLLVSWYPLDDCSVRTKVDHAAEAGYSVILFQDPMDEDDSSSSKPLTPLLAPLSSSTSSFEYGWTDASVYAFTINPADWDVLSRNFTNDDYYLSFEEPNSMSGWFTYFIVGVLVIGAVFFTIGLSYVIVQLLVLILIWIRESIVSRIQQIRRDRRRRVPASQLKKIPIQQWNSDMLQDMCSICLESFVETDRVRILPCSHVFHQACIDPWLLKQRRKCPNCKRKIVFPDENRDSDSSSDDERTPLLRRGSSSFSSSSTSPRNSVRPHQEQFQRRVSSDVQVGQINRMMTSAGATARHPNFDSNSCPHHQPSPHNSSINSSSEPHGTRGSPAQSNNPQDIKGKVDQLCARVESVGRKIKKKVKASQASKLGNDSSSDLSTSVVQPVLVSVTVENQPPHHNLPDTDTEGSGSQSQSQPPHEQEDTQEESQEEEPSTSTAEGTSSRNSKISPNNFSQGNSSGEDTLEVKVVPDCPTSGASPSHASSSSNSTRQEINHAEGETSILSDLNA